MNSKWKVTLGVMTVAAIGTAAWLVIRKLMRNSDSAPSDDYPYGRDAVDLYIEESFPASDAPSYSPSVRLGGIR